MSTDTKLGQLITDPAAQRDAIHIAIAPVVAGHIMLPGAHVGLNEYGKAVMPVRGSPSPIGIVDPFLEATVKEGQTFWLCLYQQTVTGMRHHWSHPAFKDGPAQTLETEPPDIASARAWIEAFASRCGITYAEMMQGASRQDLCFGDVSAYDWWDDAFWTHYKTITGKTGTGSFFTCSC